ncbi:hypothetical protein AZE42_07972 [Rhizopogon vesiculosus]|uniref:Uncharacterized protein n=1 Tax=Rhizopogon vesiculosus TaxID=180088 RepID=A0A1J8R388_9AGAM|nr:hypothetical protein AZE42_07972 [Rhizopogon vesiculosus]
MPSPTQRQRAATARRMETPQKSPNKRLAEIEAALGEQASSISQRSNLQQDAAPENGRTHSFLFGSSTQSSETSTDVDWEDTLPGVSGVEPSSFSTSSDYGTRNSDFRTPKKPRVSSVEPSSDVRAPQNLLMTPPQTVHRRAGTSSSQGTLRTDFPSTPTRNKGKERADPRGEQSIEDDTAAPTAGLIVPGSSDSGSNAVRCASPNPFLDDNTIAERISSHLEALSVLQAVPYIRKLERKYNALNLSNKTKARYIEEMSAAKKELEDEIAQLRQQNTDLQERLQRSEQSKNRSHPTPSFSMNRRF